MVLFFGVLHAVEIKYFIKLRDGQPLGNRSNAADDFDAMDDDDEDFLA